ncbi:MAG: serine O-acetyltransferase EpsC [Eubacteriales bacterium]|nr:serine O-acetyltransferase EpsC [Eubacteriales bacterium]
MKESMKDLILNASARMTDSCHMMDFIVSRGQRRLPGRGVIIGILKDLRRVMFPGFFGDENITVISPSYFIGDRLTHVYAALKEQVAISLYYRDYDKFSREEIDERAEEICAEFFRRLPDIQLMLMKDVQAGYDGDPAAKSREEVVFSYPGLFAIFVYRIAHEFYVQNVPFLPRIMTEYAHSRTGIDINSGAKIGEYFFIDHGTGVVIGETTEIGDYVKLYQGVTLGALSTRSGQKLKGKKRHPTIENHVTVYSGASILGGETVIGEGVIVAGGAFVTKSVPPYTKVIVKNPELQIKDSDVKVELQGAENKEGIWEI